MPNTEKGTNEQSSFRSADKDVKTRVPKKIQSIEALIKGQTVNRHRRNIGVQNNAFKKRREIKKSYQ